MVSVSETAAKPFRSWFGGDYKIIPNGIPVDELLELQPKIERFNDGKTNIFFIEVVVSILSFSQFNQSFVTRHASLRKLVKS